MKTNNSGFKANQQRYQKALSSLQMPNVLSMEDIEQKTEQEKPMMTKLKSFAFSTAAAVVCLLGATGAYAADLGGIRTTFTSWFNGEQTSVEAVPNEGENGYTFYSDGEYIGAGGGVAYDDFGNEIPLNADDVYENSFTETITEEDGRIILTAKDRKVDLTDLFRDANPIHVTLTVNGQLKYYEIEKIGGEDLQGFGHGSDTKPLFGTKASDYISLDEK